MIRARDARWPRPLTPGARVALVAPAGPLRNADELERAVSNARSLQWEPVIGQHVLARRGYFAGDDAVRAADLTAAISDPDIAGIWCVRGGYGAMRVLPDIDFTPLQRRPKALLGFSDITALHAAMSTRCDVISFHAPTARQALSPCSRDSLVRASIAQSDSCGLAPDARTLRGGAASGVLAGGNLALLAALCGTPFAPDLRGAIVVLEDINEAVYRVDRMLRQLLLAGALDGCSAIAFGHCTACAEESDDGARTLDEVLTEIADALGVPCLAGIPVGHIADQWTLPLGAPAELDADARRLTVIAPAR